MARDKKKSLGIKTARYFTKTCIRCEFEYPNWFTNCPKCGAAWDEPLDGETIKSIVKTIKIVVKITQEDFDQELKQVILIFSADKGKSWYKMKMENKNDYFIIELADVPKGSVIIYYIEVILKNGEKVVENNEGKFYYYTVGSYAEEVLNDSLKQEQSEILETESSHKDFHEEFKYKSEQNLSSSIPNDPLNQNMNIRTPLNPQEYRTEDNMTIFGKQQTEIDPELKNCSNCSSKIKKMWSICPICGNPT